MSTRNPRIMMGNTLVENYFCPEDGCIRILQEKIRNSGKSVLFLTYSFTHPKIANELIIKNTEGVMIKGIIEKGTDYSQYSPLKSAGLNVSEHEETSILHHKVFIIDGNVVVTGSFNPTRNGNLRNDENLIIMHNEEVAGIYSNYFYDFFNKNL